MKLKTRNLPSGPQVSAGFTLLEIMLAVLILGIGLIMVAMLFPVAADQQRRAASDSMASEIGSMAFGLLEARLKRNYFTYPGTYVTPNPTKNATFFTSDGKPRVDIKVGDLMKDYRDAVNNNQADPEKDPWPPGAWTVMFDAYSCSMESDFPRTKAPGEAPWPGCFYTYCYLRWRACYWPNAMVGYFLPIPAPNQFGIEMFALDKRIASKDRRTRYPGDDYWNISDTDHTPPEWGWDFCLRMDPSGAMHAIVFVFRKTDQTSGQEMHILWKPLTNTSQDYLISDGFYFLIPRPFFGNRTGDGGDFTATDSSRTSGRETWVVSRVDGSVQRQVSWAQQTAGVWAPIWYANQPPKPMPIDSVSGIFNSQGSIITCNHLSSRRYWNAGYNNGAGRFENGGGSVDPTVAVFSKVLKLEN